MKLGRICGKTRVGMGRPEDLERRAGWLVDVKAAARLMRSTAGKQRVRAEQQRALSAAVIRDVGDRVRRCRVGVEDRRLGPRLQPERTGPGSWLPEYGRSGSDAVGLPFDERIAMAHARSRTGLGSGRRGCCLALGVLAFAPAAVEAHTPAPQPAQIDSATATGTTGTYSSIEIHAQSGPSGENPTGTASVSTVVLPGRPPVRVFGPVSCLMVTGNTAVLNYQPQISIGIVTVRLTDNGGNGLDEFTVALLQRLPTDCSPVAGGLTARLDPGRATVVDAQPLPTSTRQCKNGGWSHYGFKNQGQCIRFVRHDEPQG
jgi:hypothetical protein